MLGFFSDKFILLCFRWGRVFVVLEPVI